MNNDILLVFVKSYQDNTSNERYFQLIMVFNFHSVLRDIKYEIGLPLQISYYGFIKVPYYMFIC